MENLQLHGFNHSIAYLEAKGLSKCFECYTINCPSEEIMEIGFNKSSGYVYIALENGVQICSMLGNDIEFITYDFNEGDELYFDSYKEAVEYSF